MRRERVESRYSLEAVDRAVVATIIDERGAFEASLIGYLVPIVVTVVGVVLLDESIGAITLIGFGLVIVGFSLLKQRAIADAMETSTGVRSP
ncbi:EamA family transporter [Natrinema halophilum]|uniref:EamA family transporter n=1 Tax=Natrinema halophilum TaxID=1699371 RepID=UPI003CCCE7F7